MLYLLIKSLHMSCVILWITGMVMQALLLAGMHWFPVVSQSIEHQRLTKFCLYSRIIVVPAMLIALLTGIWMAISGTWYNNGWFLTKILIVLALSSLHGMVSSRLKKALRTLNQTKPAAITGTLPVIMLMMAAIVLLVIFKPF